MSGLYSGGDLDNFIDLINETNSETLPWPVNKTDFLFGVPQVISGATDDKPNTTVRIQARNNSVYRGTVDVEYRRLNLATLFRGIKVELHRFWNSTQHMTNIVPLINEMYGLNLHQDFGNGASWSTSQSGISRVLSLNSNNYMYTGSVAIWMYMDKEELGLDVLTVQDIDRIQWPGGNQFEDEEGNPIDRRGQGQFLLTGGEFTEHYQTNNINGDIPIQYNHTVFRNTMQALHPDLEFTSIASNVWDIQSSHVMMSPATWNNRTLATESQNNALYDLMRSKAALDRDVPLHGHGFNRIGHYTPTGSYRLAIVNARDPETGEVTDFTPIVGEIVIKHNRLW